MADEKTSLVPTLTSFRAMHMALLLITVIFTAVVAFKARTVFAWVTFATAIVSTAIAYFSIIPRGDPGDRR